MLQLSPAMLGMGFNLDRSWLHLLAGTPAKRFKIGACDWSIHSHSQVEAMALAEKIGLHGVQVSLGNQENNMHLRQKSVQEAYLQAARQHHVQIGGLAIGELNQVAYKTDRKAQQWVVDSIDVAKAIGVKVILLAFFNNGDLKGDEEGTNVVIDRLKLVAPKAEKNGIILGIESWLSAEEHVAIMDAVGSPNIQVYYDVANSHEMGYDIYKEIRWLGKDRICEFHAKENGYLLGTGEIDFKEVRKALDDIDYEGWIMIEGAVPNGAEMFDSYVKNARFMHNLFGA